MIPIAMPLVGEQEATAAAESVLSGWLTQGPQVAAFEREFCDAVGAAHACAVSNCTTALHLALLALDVGPGDEVVTVSHTFIASANAIRQCGATPVFVDIEPDGFNIDAEALARAVTPATKAILVVHQMGMPCDLAAILPIARARGLPVIEDAACAIGSEILLDGAWRRVGAPHGDIACFSFHPRKVLTVGDGGMLTTNNAEWDARFRLWRQHGMSAPDTVRHNSPRVMFESYDMPGYNYRMTDVQAAVGRAQLRRLGHVVDARRRLAARYVALLSGVEGVRPPVEPIWARSNWQSFCVRLDPRFDQRAVMQDMLDSGVATRRGIMCIHLEPAYADLPLRFPLNRSVGARDGCILLPLFVQMTDEIQNRVVDALVRALDQTAGGFSRAANA